MNSPIRFTPRILIIAVTAAVVIWLLVLIKGILLLIFIALLIALILEPAVDWLHKHRIPRGLAVFLSVFIVVGVFGGLIGISISPIITQTELFISQFPKLLGSVVGSVFLDSAIKNFGNTLVQQVASTSSNLVKITIDVFQGIITLVSILVFSIYMLIDIGNIRSLFVDAFKSEEHKEIARKTLNQIQSQLGAWLRGQLLLMLIIGFGVFLGLSLLRIPYALPLAIIAGFMEIVPILGPIISAIPAAIVGFAISPVIGLGVVGLFILVHQLENNLIVPKVMQKAVGFNPLITMLVLLIGSELMGVAGALLAVPITIVTTITVGNILSASHKD